MLGDALTLGLGYNATLVTIGAALLGAASGAAGTFLFLRKRALLSDAISHATLPGIGLAFIVMASVGLDGRHLGGLLLGSALSAGLGLLAVQWMTARTRLAEDAAIGAVLSVFFGIGVVLLTVIQTMSSGKQAGLEDFLLGATAGMLRADAILIAVSGGLAVLAVLLLRRPMTLVAFDAEYAAASGIDVRATDLATMGLATAVTIIGLKLVGLVLIVALLIIPPVTARLWSGRTSRMVTLSAAFGAGAGYLGAAISATAPDLPAGPIIVLVAFTLFALSLLFAPERGLIAALVDHRRRQRRVHLRQGLLALAQNAPIYERYTLRLLVHAGLARPDGVATESGRARAAEAQRDEARWRVARRIWPTRIAILPQAGFTALDDVLTPDEIAEIDTHLAAPAPVSP